MPVSTPVADRPTTTNPAPRPAPATVQERQRAHHGRLLPVVAMAGGLALVLAATILVWTAGGASGPAMAHPVAHAPADPLAITLSARDVSVVSQVYEPGQESGWHAHAGIHAVAVLSGTLTIYDSQCRAQTVEPGRPYVGGQEPHLARNETASPVEMTVTYLSPSTPTSSTRHLAAPAGCAVGQS